LLILTGGFLNARPVWWVAIQKSKFKSKKSRPAAGCSPDSYRAPVLLPLQAAKKEEFIA
jgi:hypothetical protein